MKLKKLHIISFGGLKNLQLELEDGLNCIYGDNEKGKTTLMAFIKMMFYGNERGSTQISKNVRKKYTPWDGSQMAGSIEFETNGKCYKLEREFRSSNSTDKVSLTDLSLGEKQTVEGDIGVKLFGLSAGAFERSIFIGQLGFPDSDASAESELNARLSNMVSTGDEKVSLEDVTARLEKARYSILSKTGRAGEYYKNTITAKDLSERLNESIKSNKQYLEGKEKLIAHIKETEELNRKAETLKLQLSKEQDIKNAQKLKELLETKENLEKVKKELTLKDGTPADENLLRNLKFSLSKFEGAKAKAEAKKKETEIIEKQLDTLLNGPKLSSDETHESLGEDLLSLDKNLNSLKIQIAENQRKLDELNTTGSGIRSKKTAFNPPLLIIGAILLSLAVAIFTLSAMPSIVLGSLGLILVVLSFILKPKSNKKLDLVLAEIATVKNLLNNQSAHAEDIRTQISEKKTRLEAIRLASTSNTQVIEAQRAQLLLSQNELVTLQDEEQRLKNELDAMLNRLNDNADITEILELLEKTCEKQKELKQHISFLLRDLNNISYEDAQKKLLEIESESDTTVDFRKINEEYELTLKNLTKRRETEATVSTELKALIKNAENPEILRNRLDELNNTLIAQKEFCDSADIAIEVLKESFAELRAGYGSELEKKSAEIFSLLTNGKYRDMTISKSFGINVEEAENPISREAEYLSSGTFDQAYLSLRLAVAGLLDQSLPLFLDDTLAQYDDSRASSALEFLRDYAKSNQAIMFTCHKVILSTAEKLGCKTEKL